MKKLTFIIIGLGLLLTACKKQDSVNVNQTKIWTQYVMIYNKNSDVTDIVARFRFGSSTGTLLNLTDSTGASVTFNGQEMPYSTWWSAHHIQLAGNITHGTYKYTNTSGTVYTNTFNVTADSIAFPASFDTIPKDSSASTFYWVGSALKPNESVAMYVGTWAWDKQPLFYTDADSATYLVMGADQKDGLATGPATVYLYRWYTTTSINAPSVGGMFQYKYQAKNASVQVAP